MFYNSLDPTTPSRRNTTLKQADPLMHLNEHTKTLVRARASADCMRTRNLRALPHTQPKPKWISKTSRVTHHRRETHSCETADLRTGKPTLGVAKAVRDGDCCLQSPYPGNFSLNRDRGPAPVKMRPCMRATFRSRRPPTGSRISPTMCDGIHTHKCSMRV